MAQPSGVRRVTGALSDATGRSDEEWRLALTVAVLATGVLAGLKVLKYLGELGADVLSRPRY